MKASDNPFPSVLIEETAAPANPPAGSQRLFIDPADHKLKAIDSAGVISDVTGPFEALTFLETAAPANPAAGAQALFIDPVDHLLKAIDSTGTIVTIGSGGGGGGAATGSDDFNRSDRLIAGDNGWFEAGAPGDVASLAIVGNQLVVPVGAGTGFGNQPMLRARLDSDPDVADVSFTMGRVDNSGLTVPVCVSDNHYRVGIGVEIDGTAAAGATPEIIWNGAGGPNTWDTTDSAWVDWTGSTCVIRMTYDNTTKLFSVYQDGTLRNTLDIQAALDTYYGAGTHVFPDLSLVPYAGIISNAGVGIETFEDWVCA